MMKKLHEKIMLTLTLCMLFACSGSSTVGNNGGDVGFDPTTASLKVLHADAIEQRLVQVFQLDAGSAALALLDDNRAILSLTNLNAAYKTAYVKIMAKACEEASSEVLYPNGIQIDHVWTLMTGQNVDQGARALESAILTDVSSEGDDMAELGLCMAASVDMKAISSNL